MWRNEWAILDDLLHFDFCIIIFIISASYKTGLTNICMWIMLLEPNPIMQNAILQPHISINWWYKSSDHQLSGQSICHHVILSSNMATIHHRRQPFPCPISRVHTWHPLCTDSVIIHIPHARPQCIVLLEVILYKGCSISSYSNHFKHNRCPKRHFPRLHINSDQHFPHSSQCSVLKL